MTDNSDYIMLKWGTIKAWDLQSGSNVHVIKKLGEWEALGSSLSAMAQRDTDEQKRLICEAIDLLDGTIQNDWSGDVYSKEQAKEYVMNYGKK